MVIPVFFANSPIAYFFSIGFNSHFLCYPIVKPNATLDASDNIVRKFINQHDIFCKRCFNSYTMKNKAVLFNNDSLRRLNYMLQILMFCLRQIKIMKIPFQWKNILKNHFPFFGIKTPRRRELMREFYLQTGILKQDFQEDFVAKLWELEEKNISMLLLIIWKGH